MPPRRLSSLFASVSILLVIAFAATNASAHPEGFSQVRVILRNDSIHLELEIHTRDLVKKLPNVTDASAVRHLTSIGHLLYQVQVNYNPLDWPKSAKATIVEPGLIRVDLDYPNAERIESLKVEYTEFQFLPDGHQQYVLVEDARNRPADVKPATLLQDRISGAASMSVLEPVPAPPPVRPTPATNPSGTQPSVGADAGEPSAAAQPYVEPKTISRINFFTDGILHILSGIDHLLFVAALLLACKTFREAATIITFFTVAHSITLALSSLDVVVLPASIVEPAIAVTILFVAVENLLHRPKLLWRCAITTFFGLIHGLAFANELKEKLNGDTLADILAPLLQFSAGVEVGHLSLVAAALPALLWMKRRKPALDRYVSPGLSGVIGACGAFWLVTRVWENWGA